MEVRIKRQLCDSTVDSRMASAEDPANSTAFLWILLWGLKSVQMKMSHRVWNCHGHGGTWIDDDGT